MNYKVKLTFNNTIGIFGCGRTKMEALKDLFDEWSVLEMFIDCELIRVEYFENGCDCHKETKAQIES